MLEDATLLISAGVDFRKRQLLSEPDSVYQHLAYVEAGVVHVYLMFRS